MLAPSATTSGVAPFEATPSTRGCSSRGTLPPGALHKRDDSIGRPLAEAPSVRQIDATHAGLRGERDELRPLRDADRGVPLGPEDGHNALPFRRLISR